MNIVTYVSPMGRRPIYYYALSLYRTTLSYDNFLRHGWGLLSLLDQDMSNANVIIPLLGKQSGRDVDKMKLLRDQNIGIDSVDWANLPNLHKHVRSPSLSVLNATRSILGIKRIPNQSPLFCGDHDLFLCEVTDHWVINDSPNSQALSTQTLRQLNLL